MPIYDILCSDCGHAGEAISLAVGAAPACPACGGANTVIGLSAPSSLTGKTRTAYPGPTDRGCCGTTPSQSGCAGPGSCCGKNAG